MVTYEVAVGLTIGAIIGATVFRTFLPWFIKIMAEIQLAARENRDPQVPRIHWIWLALAGINIVIVSFPLFAQMDTFVIKIIDTLSPIQAFAIVWGLVMIPLEVLFRMGDAGINNTDTQPPKPTTETTTTNTQPSG